MVLKSVIMEPQVYRNKLHKAICTAPSLVRFNFNASIRLARCLKAEFFFLKFQKTRMCSEACQKHGLLLRKTCMILLFCVWTVIGVDTAHATVCCSPRLCGIWAFQHRLFRVKHLLYLSNIFDVQFCSIYRRLQAFHHPRRPLCCCLA